MLKSLRQGSTQVSDTILNLAQELIRAFQDPLHLLTGVSLTDPGTGQPMIVDLIGLMPTAAFVSIDIDRETDQTTTPTVAAQQLAVLVQRGQTISQPLPIYAFWSGEAKSGGHVDDALTLSDTTAVQRYLQLASARTPRLTEDTLTALVEELMDQDAGLQEHKRSLISHLRHGLKGLADLPRRIDAGLQGGIRRSYLFRRSGPVLPADVNKHLEAAMLARENVLEDADYGKIVPNQYVVELNIDNYQRNYLPIEHQIRERWQARLREVLDTTNQRWGRAAY